MRKCITLTLNTLVVFKETNLSKMRTKKPAHILEHAIKGMLPKNKLQAGMLLRLKVVPGPTHQFEAQKPEVLAI